MTRRFTVENIYALKLQSSPFIYMLGMKHTPCFRAAAAWGNFSALCRDFLSVLFLQFPSASVCRIARLHGNGLKQLGHSPMVRLFLNE